MTALVISNQEMKYIMKWVKSCEEPDMILHKPRITGQLRVG